MTIQWHPLADAPPEITDFPVPVLLTARFPSQKPAFPWAGIYRCWSLPEPGRWFRWPHDFPPTHYAIVNYPEDDE